MLCTYPIGKSDPQPGMNFGSLNIQQITSARKWNSTTYSANLAMVNIVSTIPQIQIIKTDHTRRHDIKHISSTSSVITNSSDNYSSTTSKPPCLASGFEQAPLSKKCK